MNTRKLGANGPDVSAIGLGCMGMSEFYGPSDQSSSLAVLDRSIELGINLWDTADMYGSGRNEQLVGKALSGSKRDKVVLATKFSVIRGEGGSFAGISGKPEYVKSACDASLQRLGIDVIDLYYQHRVDRSVPIEDTVGAMKELVDAGKVRFLGLSEASPATIRRAHAVHPISALQTEYSLWSRDPEDELLATCAELGIAFVAYSPLGRGFLSGTIRSLDDLDPGDYRRFSPRFQGDNFAKNLAVVDKVAELAAKRDCSAAQLAIAWLLARGQHIVPIPGTRNVDRLAQNAAATDIELTAEELAAIEAVAPVGVAAGDRYHEAGMASLNG